MSARSALAVSIAILAWPSTSFAQVVAFDVRGTVDDERLGTSVAALGDLDGDGTLDLLTAGRGPQTGHGFAHVYSGATGALLLSVQGPSNVLDTTTYFGHAVAALGDVDGDSLPDFAVSAPGEDSGTTATGTVRGYSGATGALLYTFSGPQFESNLGHGLAVISDVDSDGASDLVVGAPGNGGGRVSIHSGRTGVEMGSYRVNGTRYGTDVSTCGDIDLDGRADVLVGASGFVEIRSGANFTLIRRITGPQEQTLFGTAVSGLDDLDLDGVPDLVVGERFHSDSRGRALVYSGATGAWIRSFVGDWINHGLGSHVANPGDVDGDGIGDVSASTIGSRYCRVYSGATGATLYEFREAPWALAIDRTTKLASLGDLNGDGRDDVAVGYPGNSAIATNAGKVVVYTDGTPIPTGSASCFGDGTGAACPCANNGSAGEGCANATGHGSTLTATGTGSVSNDTLLFRSTRLPSSATAVLFSGTAAIAPAVFGDGLRCAGGTLRRIRTFRAENGTHHVGPDLSVTGGWSAGDTRWFQVQYRNIGGACGSGFNLTNALGVTFTP